MDLTFLLSFSLLFLVLLQTEVSSARSPFETLFKPNHGNQSSFNGTLQKTSDGRIIAYMIPPFKANHASFIEKAPGHLLVAWFSGSSEGDDDVAIVLSRLADGSNQWTAPVTLSVRTGYSNQNPVLYYNNWTDIVHLFHSQQPADNFLQGPEGEGNEAYATVWELQSPDHGQRWTTPRLVFSRPGTFDKNRIVTLNSGQTWLFPIYSTAGSKVSQEYSMLSVSTDFGETWNQTTFPNTNYLVQPSVIHVPDTNPSVEETHLRVFFRDRRAQHIYTATSADSGNQWTDPKQTPLLNNNAAIQSIPLISGRVAIVFDNSTSDRTPLTLALSEDGGLTWPYSRDLEPLPDQSDKFLDPSFQRDVEYSYPSIIQTKDGNLHITYTYNRDTIKYVQCNEAWVMHK